MREIQAWRRWLGALPVRRTRADQASVSTGPCRVKAYQKLWSNKGPRTVTKSH